MRHPAQDGGSLQLDEAGTFHARLGGHVLRAGFRPVFGIDREDLRLVAIEGAVIASRDGETVAADDLLRALGPAGRARLVTVGRALVLLNHGNAGMARPDMLLGADLLCPPGQPGGLADLEALLPDLAETGFEASQIVCLIMADQFSGVRDVRALAADLRSLGIAVAIDGFAGSARDQDFVATTRPDIVRLDAAWFEQISMAPAAMRLLARFAERMEAAGTSILVDGLETNSRLVAALGAGAALVAGPLLGSMVRAGSPLPRRPINIGDLISSHARIIPMLRYRR